MLTGWGVDCNTLSGAAKEAGGVKGPENETSPSASQPSPGPATLPYFQL